MLPMDVPRLDIAAFRVETRQPLVHTTCLRADILQTICNSRKWVHPQVFEQLQYPNQQFHIESLIYHYSASSLAGAKEFGASDFCAGRIVPERGKGAFQLKEPVTSTETSFVVLKGRSCHENVTSTRLKLTFGGEINSQRYVLVPMSNKSF